MKKAFFASIRFQVIILYLLILGLTIGGLGFLLYADLSNRLERDLDAKLELRAQGIDDSIRTYWQTEKLEMTNNWPTEHLFFKRNNNNFEQIANRLTTDDLQDASLIADISLIFDFTGTLIAASQPITNAEQFKTVVVSAVLTKQATFTTFKKMNVFGTTEIPIRVISRPIIEANDAKYVIVVMASMIPLQKELSQLKHAFMIQVPIILLIAILGALVLVQVTLSPVDEMVQTIRQIKPDNLKLRLSVPRTNDEIARLAQTFNDMLGELERSFTAQRQILQDISHELKTPLTVLQGQQEVTLRRDRDISEYKGLLHSNLEEIEKMKRLVHNMLLLAKFDKDSQLLEMKTIDLNPLTEQVVEDIRKSAMAKNIELKATIPNTPLIVKGNETHLRHLLMNLLDNAVKYTPDKGKVFIKLTKSKPDVHISVNDTGVGIAEKDLPYIFDRFYRVDKSRTGGEGFGLGLSIVKSILDLHKGTIQVKSDINKGTTFEVALPLAPIEKD